MKKNIYYRESKVLIAENAFYPPNFSFSYIAYYMLSKALYFVYKQGVNSLK